MYAMKTRVQTLLLALAMLWSAAAAGQAPAPASVPTTLAPGIIYRNLKTAAAAGEPWSIHILEVSRAVKSVELRAVEGAAEDGSMQRELPTALAARVAASEAGVVAVVNGD